MDFFAVFEHFCLACPGKRAIGEARSLGTQDPMTKNSESFLSFHDVICRRAMVHMSYDMLEFARESV